MQVNLTGHHVDITEPLRAYVDEKIARLERHFDHVTNVHVILSVEKLRHTAEATLRLNGGNLFADATDGDMYAAIDALTDKLTTGGDRLGNLIRRRLEALRRRHRVRYGERGQQLL